MIFENILPADSRIMHPAVIARPYMLGRAIGQALFEKIMSASIQSRTPS